MSTTPNLALPYLAAGQAQKHVTLNESLKALDALVHMGVVSRALANPPASPVEGQRYLIPAGGTGAFAGRSGQIAAFQDGGWLYYLPRTGWLSWVADEALLLVFNGSAWVSAGGTMQNLPFVGINATADTTSRLAVSAAATLLNHAGNGHQLKINKAGVADTASLLFQTGFSGRAELGLAGNDSLTLKLSANGANWAPVLTATPTQVSIGPNQLPATNTSGLAAMEISASLTGDRYAFFDFHASDAQPDYSARFIRNPGSNGNFVIECVGSGDINLNPGGNVNLFSGSIPRTSQSATAFKPFSDNAYSLGDSGLRWSAIWAANGVIQTSDQRDKKVEQALKGPVAGTIVDSVSPVLFRWKEGGAEVVVVSRKKDVMNAQNPQSKHVEHLECERRTRPGKRLHAGFLAQDVKSALEACDLDFSVWGVEDPGDPKSRQWLRPDQLIPLLWAALKETREDVKRLSQKKGQGPE